MAAALIAGVSTAAAAADSPPLIQLEPGLDAGCVAQVSVDSARLVRAVPQWWARQYKWEGIRFACNKRGPDGSVPFTWNVPGLGITGGGSIVNAGLGAAQWKWQLAAEKEWPVMGEPGAKQPHGGLSFFLDLKSAARRSCTADPVLKADKTGFTWEVTPGKTIAVGFSTPLAALYFEQGHKSEIRCMFYDAPIVVGKLDQTMTIALPEGGAVVPPLEERYAADSKHWFTGALEPHAAFVDLSYLNDKPAGRHGFLQAKGSELAFADGTPARLWGFGLQAGTLYLHTKNGQPDREIIDRHTRRLAQLGANLIRLTHVDSDWVHPQLIAQGPTTESLDGQAVNTLFYWIKALKDQGIYVWVDMITYRPFLRGDNIPGFEEISAHGQNKQRPLVEGYSYLNPRIEELWRKTSQQLVTRVNPHTGLTLKDDPAVAGIMIWNENDLTGHFGLAFLPDIAGKYRCGLCDIRAGWLAYPRANHYQPGQLLLKDGAHLNTQGNYLMAQLTNRYLVYRPDFPDATWKGLSATHPVGTGAWKDGVLAIEFKGNRVDVIPAAANEKDAARAGGSGRVLIDGKKPSEFPGAYRITRPQPGPWSPLFLSRVDHDAPLALEDWTLRVSHVSADGKTWKFDVSGSVTEQDGSGQSDRPFVSKSGRVKIDPAAWFRGFCPPLPEGYTIRWKVLPMFADAYQAPEIDDPTKENATTVVQGIANGTHTLEIVADIPASPPAIASIRTYCPPVKAD
jgi:hypothetical protein